MNERLGNIFDNQPEIQEKPLEPVEELEDSELSPENRRYREMEMAEVISDDSKIATFVVSRDRKSIIYSTSAMPQELKVWDRGRGEITHRIEQEVRDQHIVEVMQESQHGQAFLYRIGNQFVSKDKRTFNTIYSGELHAISLSESKDGRKLILNDEGSVISVNDLYSGDRKVMYNQAKPNTPPEDLEEIDDNTLAAAYDKNVIIFDIEQQRAKRTLEGHEKSINCLSTMNGGKILLTGSEDKTVKFWDTETGQCLQSMDVKRRVSYLEALPDGKHIAFYTSTHNDSTIRIMDVKSGKCVKSFQGTGFQILPGGDLAVMNEGRIEFWQIGYNKNFSPEEHLIRGDREITEEDRFFEFKKEEFEGARESSWLQYTNMEATRLQEKKQFKWADERLYFDIPLEDFEKLKDLVIKIAEEQKIAVSFKYLDTQKSSPESGNEATRFVVNFASPTEAKRFYVAINQTEEYQSITPDRETDYFAFNLDGKAHYASGYREIRENDYNQLKSLIESLHHNADGTYSYPDDGTGDQNSINEEEYKKLVEDLENKRNISLQFKEKWDNS